MRLIAVALLFFSSVAHADTPEIYFSPHGGCEAAVVRELGAATKEVHVQAYGFTDAAIAKALIDASKRGVAVSVLLDKSNRTGHRSEASLTASAGIPTAIDARHAIAHNKVMVIDGKTVITGSFNFTSAAEKSNAENLIILRDETAAAKYLANWEEHRKHSEMFITP